MKTRIASIIVFLVAAMCAQANEPVPCTIHKSVFWKKKYPVYTCQSDIMGLGGHDIMEFIEAGNFDKLYGFGEYNELDTRTGPRMVLTCQSGLDGIGCPDTVYVCVTDINLSDIDPSEIKFLDRRYIINSIVLGKNADCDAHYRRVREEMGRRIKAGHATANAKAEAANAKPLKIKENMLALKKELDAGKGSVRLPNGKAINTIKIGDANWTAEDIGPVDFLTAINSCPADWHVAMVEDWRNFQQYLSSRLGQNVGEWVLTKLPSDSVYYGNMVRQRPDGNYEIYEKDSGFVEVKGGFGINLDPEFIKKPHNGYLAIDKNMRLEEREVWGILLNNYYTVWINPLSRQLEVKGSPNGSHTDPDILRMLRCVEGPYPERTLQALGPFYKTHGKKSKKTKSAKTTKTTETTETETITLGELFGGIFGSGKNTDSVDVPVLVTPLSAKASATSEPSRNNSYEASNLLNDNPAAAWAAPFDGTPVKLSFEVPNKKIDAIYIENGYWKDEKSLKNNGRVQQIVVYINGTPTDTISVADIQAVPATYEAGKGGLTLNLKESHPGVTNIDVEILSAYPGKKWETVTMSSMKFVSMERQPKTTESFGQGEMRFGGTLGVSYANFSLYYNGVKDDAEMTGFEGMLGLNFLYQLNGRIGIRSGLVLKAIRISFEDEYLAQFTDEKLLESTYFTIGLPLLLRAYMSDAESPTRPWLEGGLQLDKVLFASSYMVGEEQNAQTPFVVALRGGLGVSLTVNTFVMDIGLNFAYSLSDYNIYEYDDYFGSDKLDAGGFSIGLELGFWI